MNKQEVMPAYRENRFPPLFHWHIKFYKEV